MTCTDFRTTFPLPASGTLLDPRRGELLLTGSCFTDEMGARLRACGYPSCVNPCGVQYNPASIAALLEAAMGGSWPADVFFTHDDMWRCWLLPTAFARPSEQECRRVCDAALAEMRRSLSEAEALIVTLGTAWIYEHVEKGYRGIVGNCHKVPAREFSRRRLRSEEIIALWRPLIESLHNFNPALRLIFTVSPIRHFKDGAHENTLSKATLHLAVDELISSPLPLQAEYFPAWELLMDDLRDYRFYAPDMLHPSPVAVDYIWRRFSACYFSGATRAEMSKRAAEIRRAAHRPIIKDCT